MADEAVDREQTQRIGELTARLASLETALASSPITAVAVRDLFPAVEPRAIPPDVADGQIITAAHINAIKASVNLWQGDVNAGQFSLNNVKQVNMVSGLSGDGLELRQTAAGGYLLAGFQDARNAARIGAYSGSWRPVEIVGASGEAAYFMNSNQDGYVSIGFDAANNRGKINCYNPAGGGWRTLVINEAGSVQMFLGGTLKTLSVDGSGFVKAT